MGRLHVGGKAPSISTMMFITPSTAGNNLQLVNKKVLILTSHGQVVMFSPVKFGGYLGLQKLTPVTNALSNKISAKGGIKFRFHKQVHGLMWLPLPKKVIPFFLKSSPWAMGKYFLFKFRSRPHQRRHVKQFKLSDQLLQKNVVVLQHQQIIIMCFGKLHVVSATLSRKCATGWCQRTQMNKKWFRNFKNPRDAIKKKLFVPPLTRKKSAGQPKTQFALLYRRSMYSGRSVARLNSGLLSCNFTEIKFCSF